MTRWLIIYGLLSFAFFSKGQTAHAYRFQHLTVNDGLAKAQVTDIKEDKYGQLWVSTTGGLSLYDGYTVVNYQEGEDATEIEYDQLYQMAADTVRNCMWFATQGGFSRSDQQEQVFSNYKEGIDVGLRTNLSRRTFDIHLDEQGVFWGASYLGGISF